MKVYLDRKDGLLSGYIIDKDGDRSDIKKVEESNGIVTIYFKFNHSNVDLKME